MSSAKWKVKLSARPFRLKQNEYDCNSTFIVILAKSGSNYDREVLGDTILKDLEYEEWGCIDPPGPNAGFGGAIDPDFLDELADEEGRSMINIQTLKGIGDLPELAGQIFPYMDGIFFANADSSVFEELPHMVSTIAEFLHSANDDDFIEIVEYEES